jgi:hypothetical protein
MKAHFDTVWSTRDEGLFVLAQPVGVELLATVGLSGAGAIIHQQCLGRPALGEPRGGALSGPREPLRRDLPGRELSTRAPG